MALLCGPHLCAMSGRQLLCRENGLLGAAIWPRLHSSSVRAISSQLTVRNVLSLTDMCVSIDLSIYLSVLLSPVMAHFLLYVLVLKSVLPLDGQL